MRSSRHLSPQVAMVGFGSIKPRPWALEGMIGVRPLVTASLAADDRVSDGHRGARFLNPHRSTITGAPHIMTPVDAQTLLARRFH